MRVLVTAGPTRQYIDSVRFITNASSGRMGFAVAQTAAQAGHDVVLLAGPVCLDPPPGCRVERFVTFADLKGLLADHFEACDALVMAAAVGDFQPDRMPPGKIRRAAGPITLHLLPTEDLLAGLAARRRAGQVVIAFAVEDGPDEAIEAKARREMADKGADYVVVNTPQAMEAPDSRACILGPSGAVLPWACRAKQDLAGHVVALLGGPKPRSC